MSGEMDELTRGGAEMVWHLAMCHMTMWSLGPVPGAPCPNILVYWCPARTQHEGETGTQILGTLPGDQYSPGHKVWGLYCVC